MVYIYDYYVNYTRWIHRFFPFGLIRNDEFTGYYACVVDMNKREMKKEE